VAYTYPTINTVSTTSKGSGTSDTAALQTLFPSSPGVADYPGSDGASTYKSTALSLLLAGAVTENLQLGEFDRDFGDGTSDESKKPPTYSDVETGGGGLPASAWVPNPASPTDDTASPSSIPSAPDGYGLSPTNSLANVGSSVDVTQAGRDPLTSSARMAKGEEIVDYSSGQSPATANAS